MQASFFDDEERLAKLEKPGDPLPRLDSIVDWKAFRPQLRVIHDKQRKSNAGGKPHEVTLMFKMLVLQALYKLSDDQSESSACLALVPTFSRSFTRRHGAGGQDTVVVSRAVGTPWFDKQTLPAFR